MIGFVLGFACGAGLVFVVLARDWPTGYDEGYEFGFRKGMNAGKRLALVNFEKDLEKVRRHLIGPA